MVNSYYNNSHDRHNFILQKNKILKYFPTLNCVLKNNVLIIEGILYPFDDDRKYRILIKYKYKDIPRVWIKGSRDIEDFNLHKYVGKGHDRRLCLYYPLDFKWNMACNIHETIIPWISEWIICYEYYKLFGKWGAIEAPHSSNMKKE